MYTQYNAFDTLAYTASSAALYPTHRQYLQCIYASVCGAPLRKRDNVERCTCRSTTHYTLTLVTDSLCAVRPAQCIVNYNVEVVSVARTLKEEEN